MKFIFHHNGVKKNHFTGKNTKKKKKVISRSMIKVYIFFDFNSPTENTDATTAWKFNMIEVILVDKPS